MANGATNKIDIKINSRPLLHLKEKPKKAE